MFVFHFEKDVTAFGFLQFSSSFVCVRRSNSAYLAFRTIGIEDTHQTLAAIPFQVGVNNSLNLSSLQAYKKKFEKFPFL